MKRGHGTSSDESTPPSSPQKHRRLRETTPSRLNAVSQRASPNYESDPESYPQVVETLAKLAPGAQKPGKIHK